MRKIKTIDSQAHVLNKLNIEVRFEELANKISTAKARPEILAIAEETLGEVINCWNPAIVYRWLHFRQSKEKPGECRIYGENITASLALGHCFAFIEDAEYVVVAAYSLGNEIEVALKKELNRNAYLVSYILDLIYLLVLEKTGDIVKKIAEEKAAELGWGVSPFLSPGSNSGWDLEDQIKLCRVLPLKNIGLQIQENAVLVPFKSLSCLIGIGPHFNSTSVGTTCQVCSKNDTCKMVYKSESR